MAVKCDQLTYTPINALTFRISGGTKVLVPHKLENRIYSLEGPDGLNLSVGLTIPIKGVRYKINLIEEKEIKGVITYELSVAKRTKSSIYILPMLGGNRNLFLWNKLLVNVFIATEENNKCIALLYRFSADPLFLKFEKALCKFKNFISKIDVDSYHVLFIFDVPKNHKNNYEVFINGKYSELQKLYKLNILEFHDQDISSQMGQILFKSEKRKQLLERLLDVNLPKNSELYSIINIEEETFNPEVYNCKK
jgi:hypothetical protein|tara:strand:- start:21530 stop:22282 length:753 start_codon:yes stop_codon:yes gene_type:complete